jgi:NAD(P)H-quinone oxidoreductase subunit 5
MIVDALFDLLGTIVTVMPALLVLVLGVSPLLPRPLSERAIARWTEFCVVASLLAALAVLALMVITGTRYVPLELGDWMSLPREHFHFRVKFVFDRLSIPFLILTLTLVGAIGAFANRYLHRDPGYARFYLFYAIFLFGMVMATLAGTIETLFFGWEFVGLSSALLVAYFHDRIAPVVNGFRIWSIYRLADAAFLIAALTLHHLSGEGEFSKLLGMGPWPEGIATLTSGQALGVGLLLLIAAAGKSALIPFSGWLPRAMEGPTPSSAVFYGALSVHLGAYLLLRVSPILELSFWLCAAVVILGLASAVFASIAGAVQTDAKSALAYASLTQVGIITAEIGLGLRYIPLIHMIGHACLRTLQLLRAPSLLHDYHELENAIGGRLVPVGDAGTSRFSDRLHRRLYRWGLDRGQLDEVLDRWVVHPFLTAFRWCDGMERRWTNLLTRSTSRESDRVIHAAPPVEEW